MTNPTKAQIDAGARALRERQMAGRLLRPWELLPERDRRKWQDHACVVLTAARNVK